MIRLISLALMLACLGTASCGKRGPLSLPGGVESLPDDPSKRSDPPA